MSETVVLLLALLILSGIIHATSTIVLLVIRKKLVTREEIETLAGSIGNLRKSFSEENELLVTNLQLLTSKKNIITNERRDTILDLFSSLNKWVWDGLNVTISDFNHANFHEISGKLASIRDYYNNTNISFGKMQLLVNDDTLIKNGYDAIMETLRLHHFVENTLKNFQKALSWEKTLLEKITSKDYDFFKLSPDIRTFYEKQAIESENDKKKILDGYNDRHWELFKPVVERLNAFRDSTKESINELKKEMPNGLTGGRWSSLR